jgi:hypothetical protein
MKAPSNGSKSDKEEIATIRNRSKSHRKSSITETTDFFGSEVESKLPLLKQPPLTPAQLAAEKQSKNNLKGLTKSLLE